MVDRAGGNRSFGPWLRHRRRELDLTQEELAHRVGCAPITIRKIEAEAMRPSKQLAGLLGEHLGILAGDTEDFVDFARGEASKAPREAKARTNNLPRPVSHFIGREKELAEVGRLLSSSRLVTLTGAGGCGKTRLAIEAVNRAAERFEDGVWFVGLAAVGQPSLVIPTIAATLDVREAPGRQLLEILSRYLGSRRVLLLLDNCEHLIEVCAQASNDLLQACPQLQILATSREPLGVEGEAQFYVPSLSLPEEGKELSPRSLRESDAASLFADRARTVQTPFTIDPSNAATIAQICRRLDGMPLAIELAAAQIKALSVAQILGGLDDRFKLLTGGSRTAPRRHQTLRAAIDWSHDLLVEVDRRLLRRLSVFAGGCDRAAAAAVCADESLAAAEVQPGLTRLADQSLLEVIPKGKEVRFRILETIRLYAAEKLREAGEERGVRDRHLRTMADWAESVEPLLRGPNPGVWYERTDAEQGNVRAALEWALAGGDPRLGLRLAGAVGWYWDARSNWKEGLNTIKGLLEQAPREEADHERAMALVVAARSSLQLATGDPAEAWLEEAVRIWRQRKDSWWIAYGLDAWGWYGLYKVDVAAGRDRFKEAVDQARASGDAWILARTLKGLGAALERTDYAAARPVLEESISLWRQLGNPEGLADALNQLGTVAHGEHADEEARKLLEDSVTISRRISWPGVVVMALWNLGCVLQCLGDYDQAERLLVEGLLLARDSGDDHFMAAYLAALGGVAAVRHKPKLSVRLQGAAAAWRSEVGRDLAAWPYCEPDYECWMATARAQLSQKELDEALDEGRAMGLEQATAYALGALTEEAEGSG